MRDNDRDGIRTAPFKLINDVIKNRILKEFEDMKTSIKWNGLGKANSIMDAIAETRNGHDLGWDGTAKLMPRSLDHHHWMHFCHLLTVIYNRDHTPKKFSIIRMVIMLDIILNAFLVYDLKSYYLLVLEEEAGTVFSFSLF